jgi:hypothetical protein
MFVFTKEADIILEIEELLNYNNYTHDIEVDKRIFDDFVEGKIIYIHFVEDEESCVREYKMISEDWESIKMEYICEYED